MASTTMFVRNHQPGPTVMDEKDFEFMRWEGFGDPTGADVLPVPSELIDNHSFQRARMLGIFEVIEADVEVQALLDKAQASWNRQKSQRDGILLSNLGQMPAEEGSTPREYTADVKVKPTIGPGELPKTMDQIVGVRTKGETATPEVEKAKVVMGPRGSYF
jgi:hypothetical protein